MFQAVDYSGTDDQTQQNTHKTQTN